jgi:hypothetical protein
MVFYKFLHVAVKVRFVFVSLVNGTFQIIRNNDRSSTTDIAKDIFQTMKKIFFPLAITCFNVGKPAMDLPRSSGRSVKLGCIFKITITSGHLKSADFQLFIIKFFDIFVIVLCKHLFWINRL